MRIECSQINIANLLKMRQLVDQAGLRIQNAHLPENYQNNNHAPVCFFTQASGKGIYAASSPFTLYAALQVLNPKPESTFADFGSGLGLPCLVASRHFADVFGFEGDRRLVAQARAIQRRLGVTNVAFLKRDFLRANPARFDTIYFYTPFMDDFAPTLERVVQRAKTGTHFIVNLQEDDEAVIFPETNFAKHPLSNIQVEIGDFRTSMPQIYTRR